MPTRNEMSQSLFLDGDYPGLGRYVWSPGEGSLEWSPGLLEIYGLRRPPDTEAGFMSCLHPGDRTRIEGETEAFLTGEADSYSHSFRIVRPGGEVRYVLDRARIVRDGQGRVERIFGTNVDLTDFPHLARASMNDESRTVENGLAEAPGAFADQDRLELGQRIGDLVLADIDYGAGTVQLSDGAASLYGLGNGAMVATRERLHATFHPDDVDALRQKISAALDPSSGGMLRAEHRILLPDGSVRWVRVRKRIEFARAGGERRPARGIMAAIDITERKRTETALQESEACYRVLFDSINAGFCVVEVDLEAAGGRVDYRVIEANPAFYDRTGFPKEILGQWLRTAAPALEEHWYRIYGDVARTGQSARFEEYSELLGRWFDVFAFRIDGPELGRVAILFHDISERKRHEAHVGVLMQEVNHRSKNLLALVNVIARRTASQGLEDFVDRFSERLNALATNQDILVRSEWKQIPLRDLVRSQMAHFGDMIDDRIEMTGPDIALKPEAAEKLGMAIHELATNAAKYGALSTEAGRVLIDWTVGGARRTDFVMTWREMSGPPVTPPTRSGFGSLVSGQLLATSLDGKAEADYSPDGLRWTFDCALSSIA
ncbi:sensor histidine kinase [Wenxinia marina]|uniref:histidine kinase n=1 Tax=Wenxinia marina DSM 24838 TaxID=1123501 RepID=A0A0D0QJM5_9RHOB|nr:PAS domain-containing protein [Wenxinia marina]KIQ71188.1 Signal transduction histidine kinase [Wenxinia marina DSM 24838]GGL81801.1 hypothetical protein GCM10011392_40500 [Wenxinia marina]